MAKKQPVSEIVDKDPFGFNEPQVDAGHDGAFPSSHPVSGDIRAARKAALQECQAIARDCGAGTVAQHIQALLDVA